MPFADVIGGVARLSEDVGERQRLCRQCDSVSPDSVPIRVRLVNRQARDGAQTGWFVIAFSKFTPSAAIASSLA